MNRAWMRAAVITGLLWLPGCDPAVFQASWTNQEAPSRSRVTSEPVPADDGSAQAAADPAPDDGHDLKAITQQVQDFLAQFPSSGRESPRAPARAETPPAPPPPPGFARNPQKLAIVAPLESAPRRMTAMSQSPGAAAPAAGAMAATQVNAEAPASPSADTVKPPTPVPAASSSPRVELIEARAAASPAAAHPESAAPGANQPVTPGASPPQGGWETLITQLEALVKSNPHRLDDQLRLRLLYAITGQEDKATGPIPGVDAVQGELVTAVLRTVLAARRSVQDPVEASAPAIAAAEELRRLLAQQSSVIVPRLALVTRVNSYGDYDAVDPPHFPAGRPVHVFLYTEVKNFRSEATSSNRLRTLLGEKVEIFDAAGKVIWQRSEPSIEDRTLSPRTDFFMTMEIELPSDLPAGEYVLKVTVEDKLGATTDQQRLAFRIGTK